MSKKLKKQLLSKPVTLTAQKVDKLKVEAIDQAIRVTNILPLLILRDEFGFGKKRLEQYLTAFENQLKLFNDGRFKLEDVIEIIKEETKLDYEVAE